MNADDLDQAARWSLQLESAPDNASRRAIRERFAEWYHSREDNRTAFAAVNEADTIARDLRAEPALQLLGSQALARAEARRAWRPRWSLAGLVGVMVVVPVAALTIRQFATPATAPSELDEPTKVFETAIGQQRLVTLDDATRVLLDTGSRLAVNASTLTIRGQAEVTAARSPIYVQAGGARVAIYKGSVNVRVEDGRVELLAEDIDAIATINESSRPHKVVVKRGTLLSMADGVASVKMAPDPEAITGWQTGWLQFNDVPLTRALHEVNRYRQQPIRLSGTAAPLRISGSFRTGPGNTFLEAVAATLPATIEQSSGPPTIRVRGPQK